MPQEAGADAEDPKSWACLRNPEQCGAQSPHGDEETQVGHAMHVAKLLPLAKPITFSKMQTVTPGRNRKNETMP
jgi:hypothetical protein